MTPEHIASIRIHVALTCALAWAGCGPSPSGHGPEPDPKTPGAVSSTVTLGKVGALGKSNVISLAKLILTAVSGATPPDTVRDTATIAGNAQVTVTRVSVLKPLRTWTLSARTLDTRDSVIHSGSTAAFYVKPADTAVVSLNLASRFAMYEAYFNSLPDSVSSTVSGTGKDAVRIKRVLMKIDGEIKADSSVATSFAGGQTVRLAFDYIPPGVHAVVLEAHGQLNTFSGLLYTGSTSFNVAAGVDDSKSITLGWVGPTTGSGKINVVIGKVGKITVNGALPGAILGIAK